MVDAYYPRVNMEMRVLLLCSLGLYVVEMITSWSGGRLLLFKGQIATEGILLLGVFICKVAVITVAVMQ